MAKKLKVEKVAKETGVDAADLERLPVDALEKLDALTPDEDLLGSEPESEPKDPPKEKTLLGYHPITGVEIWN